MRNQRAPLHTALGEVHLLAGRLDTADEEARRALAVAQECRTRGWQAWALRLLGEVAVRRDPPEHAEGHYRDALALGEQLGMRPLVSHCHLGLGKLHRRIGKRDQAREHLTIATTMYREMDMQFWLEQAEADRDA
jgi:tetratricopeptide (TPR) repeat protein